MAFSAYNRYCPGGEEGSATPSLSLEQLHQLARKRAAERESLQKDSSVITGETVNGTQRQRRKNIQTLSNDIDVGRLKLTPEEQGVVTCEHTLKTSHLFNGNTEEEAGDDLHRSLSDSCCDNEDDMDSSITPQDEIPKAKKRKKKKKRHSDPPLTVQQELPSDSSDMEVYSSEPQPVEENSESNEQEDLQGSRGDSDSDTGVAADREPLAPLVPLTRDKRKSDSVMARVHRQLPKWIVEADIIEDSIQDHSRLLSDFGLPEIVVKNLARMEVLKFFPVQVHVIPELLFSQRGPLLTAPGRAPPRDVCVCAPTGCGKTLCYVVPIVTALMNRVVTQVRAVVVLPSQELAAQVHKVFEQVAHGTGIKIGIVCGQVSIEKESVLLQNSCSYPPCSGVDVLVATPGRLVEHLNRNSFATLSFLRYLVVDEADKLLDQHYSQWLPKLLVAVATDKEESKRGVAAKGQRSLKDMLLNQCCDVDGLRLLQKARTHENQRGALAVPSTTTVTSQPKSPFQKLLFSATMTYNPEHLATLNLCRPKLFTVADVLDTKYSHDSDTAFTLPAQLEERVVKCSLKDKPLVLLHLVTAEEFSPVVSKVLCFTNSREATHRLFLLVHAFGLVSVGEMSGSLSKGRRQEVLSDFKNGKIQVLICSDQMARGMDVEGVSCVVNYEPPRQFRTYLHRAGRTARAGQRGVVYTLLAHDEAHSFNTMLRKVHHSRQVGEVSVGAGEELKPLLPLYQTALEQLKTHVHNK